MSVKCCGCQELLEEDEVFKLADSCGVDICDRCASRVVHSYNEWHGGFSYAPVKQKNPRKSISAAVKLKIFQRDGFRCKHCGTSEALTIVHIQPVSKGGSNQDENLQTLCASCNSRKGVK
ncbi:HNH endonuclease [Enterobacter hormaechei]|uniref:HNH endonuclease n=1 Tax=Enterobacter hormaechei TaxID=158836 RepID=UPI00197AB127|nr:HNH endonuclease [Enterobacter hormaechei]MDG4708395.1 HNH endonuclease [Enterobacter hormaechei]